MLTPLALISSIVLQLIAVILVISLIRGSKYKSSWILLSLGLMIMAIRRFFELLVYFEIPTGETGIQVNNWLGVAISILIVIGVFYMRKIFDYMAKMQQIRQETDKKVLSAVINAEERERKRMANELHDGIGPLLSTIKMSLHALTPRVSEVNKQPLFNNAMLSIEEAITGLREISNNLSPSVLEDFGLITAIHSFISKIQTTSTLKIEFVTNLKSPYPFSTEVSLILYRATCELIHNTIKHAQAEKAMISLHHENNSIKLLYQDNGKGFNYDSLMKRKPLGMGLRTIQSRIESVAGKFELSSRPEEGIIVHLTIQISDHVSS